MSQTHNFSVQKGGENMLIKIGDFEFTEVWDWSEKVYRLIESS